MPVTCLGLVSGVERGLLRIGVECGEYGGCCPSSRESGEVVLLALCSGVDLVLDGPGAFVEFFHESGHLASQVRIGVGVVEVWQGPIKDRQIHT